MLGVVDMVESIVAQEAAEAAAMAAVGSEVEE